MEYKLDDINIKNNYVRIYLSNEYISTEEVLKDFFEFASVFQKSIETLQIISDSPFHYGGWSKYYATKNMQHRFDRLFEVEKLEEVIKDKEATIHSLNKKSFEIDEIRWINSDFKIEDNKINYEIKIPNVLEDRKNYHAEITIKAENEKLNPVVSYLQRKVDLLKEKDYERLIKIIDKQTIKK